VWRLTAHYVRINRDNHELFAFSGYVFSMKSEYELFGADIAVGNNFQASVAANGELVLTEGCDCAVQMVALHLFVLLGSLFYDVTFGSLLVHWIREESTRATREGLCVEVETRVNTDPHVIPGTAVCRVLAWDHTGVDLDLVFTLIGEAHPDHLVVRLAENDGQLVPEIVSHAHPRDDSRP
jgi:hypothetical protein